MFYYGSTTRAAEKLRGNSGSGLLGSYRNAPAKKVPTKKVPGNIGPGPKGSCQKGSLDKKVPSEWKNKKRLL
jgi:hypothetical protein